VNLKGNVESFLVPVNDKYYWNSITSFDTLFKMEGNYCI